MSIISGGKDVCKNLRCVLPRSLKNESSGLCIVVVLGEVFLVKEKTDGVLGRSEVRTCSIPLSTLVGRGALAFKIPSLGGGGGYVVKLLILNVVKLLLNLYKLACLKTVNSTGCDSNGIGKNVLPNFWVATTSERVGTLFLRRAEK